MPDQPGESEDCIVVIEPLPRTIREAKRKGHAGRKMKEASSFRLNLPVSVRYQPVPVAYDCYRIERPSATLLNAHTHTLIDRPQAVVALTDRPSNTSASRHAQQASGSVPQSGMDARVNPGLSYRYRA
jgi:hypothetical protein